VVQCLEEWAFSKISTGSFELSMANGFVEMTVEHLMLKYPEQPSEAIAAAKARLAAT
jgi:hypothetical protein